MTSQAMFARALLRLEQACPEGVFSSNGADPASRFAVYRNNVHSALTNALAIRYPVTLQLVGDEFFRAMAGLYVQAFPPSNRLISRYGGDFADFVQGFAPAASVPYLADVVRLEHLRVQAYHAADATALGQHAILATLRQQSDIGSIRLQLHPSLATLNSPYAIVALWAAHQTGVSLAAIDPLRAQSALVVRDGLEVKVFAIDRATVAFINSLANGWPLEMAMAYGLDVSTEFDLQQCLSLLISLGAITHLHTAQKVTP
ncbi:DNA-binding domain-containing protein [Pseudomonas sp. 15FMM2]|uniref:DNA-binding domain-containing protein n=1 Tax=Pseudomonas imrae TaxID=2992837 RepID=A0ACC7PAU9_9PSED